MIRDHVIIVFKKDKLLCVMREPRSVFDVLSDRCAHECVKRNLN